MTREPAVPKRVDETVPAPQPIPDWDKIRELVVFTAKIVMALYAFNIVDRLLRKPKLREHPLEWVKSHAEEVWNHITRRGHIYLH